MQDIHELLAISKKLSLLYVEDDAEVRKKTQQLFNEFFLEVTVAKDGLEGLDLYVERFKQTQTHFSIVLTDIMMPNMDGIELTRQIFSQNSLQKIVVISAYDDAKYFVELINMGVDGFIQKPFNLNEVIDVLINVCKTVPAIQEYDEIHLPEEFVWNNTLKTLFEKRELIHLSRNEKDVLFLLLNNPKKSFTTLEIFEHIHSTTEKEFSESSIKSIIKRLRKKLPVNSIKNSYDQGYSSTL